MERNRGRKYSRIPKEDFPKEDFPKIVKIYKNWTGNSRGEDVAIFDQKTNKPGKLSRIMMLHIYEWGMFSYKVLESSLGAILVRLTRASGRTPDTETYSQSRIKTLNYVSCTELITMVKMKMKL